MKYFIPILLLALWASCTRPYDVIAVDDEGMIVLEENGEDALIESIIAPYRAELEGEMNTVLCQNEKALIKARPESGLGNFVSDLCLEQARALDPDPIDFGLFNHGGLRTALPQGDITVGKIFELMPFENELIVVELPYEQVMVMLDYLIARGGEPVADLRLHAMGDSIVDVTVQGQALEQRSYRVVTSDYLAGGGDRMVFLTEENRIDQKVLGMKIREAIMSHCRELGQEGKIIKADTDGRIILE
ncbi:MAG: hypothetical protein HKN79_08095 [Flavobacteriales bacterium]|nr:hypothetical protein [Flavobacteriales bacterium]